MRRRIPARRAVLARGADRGGLRTGGRTARVDGPGRGRHLAGRRHRAPAERGGQTHGRRGGPRRLRPAPAPRTPGPDDTAYTIFTSGSTGTPKGVEIQHRAARTTIDDIVDRFGIGPEDRVLALSALSFDLSVFDVYGLLGAGGSLVLPDPARQRDPEHWLELAGRHGVTVWNTAPALLEMLVEYAEMEPEAATAALRGCGW
ncbi:AMP-binding protein [Streptomyces sp. M19]